MHIRPCLALSGVIVALSLGGCGSDDAELTAAQARIAELRVTGEVAEKSLVDSRRQLAEANARIDQLTESMQDMRMRLSAASGTATRFCERVHPAPVPSTAAAAHGTEAVARSGVVPPYVIVDVWTVADQVKEAGIYDFHKPRVVEAIVDGFTAAGLTRTTWSEMDATEEMQGRTLIFEVSAVEMQRPGSVDTGWQYLVTIDSYILRPVFPGAREWQRVVVMHHGQVIWTGVRDSLERMVQTEVSKGMDKTFTFFQEIRQHQMKAR
jgi:outer membrane murein-binding lipoprotein Lpp